MEDKILKIIELLDGEKIQDCLIILAKVTCEVNEKKTELQDTLVFKT